MDQKFKSDFISRWNRYFPGAAQPFAAFYSDHLHNAELASKKEGHHCVIADFSKVLRGKSLAFNADNLGCGGGIRYCGFSTGPRPDFSYFLSYGKPGELEGERYKRDPDTVNAWLNHVPEIKAPAKWLICKPFEKLEDDDHPEVIVFFDKPDVIAGLFTLANYDRKDPYGVKAPFSAGCGAVIQYPWLENQKDDPDCIMGMFDSSARPFLSKDKLSFAIPMKRFEILAEYMDESFLVTPTWDVIRKRMEQQ